MFFGLSQPTEEKFPLSARQVVIENLPSGTQQLEVASFLNEKLITSKLVSKPGPPVVKCDLSEDGTSATLQLRSVSEANCSLVFDRDQFKGQSVRVRRPADHMRPAGYIERVRRPFVEDCFCMRSRAGERGGG